MRAPDATSAEAERECVLRAMQGDAAAFRRLVDAYDRRLLYFVLRFLPDADRALDILQDVWLTLFRRLSTLRSPGAFRVWLYQITHDRVIDAVRKEKRQERVCETLFHERNGVAEEEPDPCWEQAELVHHALDQISPEHREVLLLRFLDDLSVQEIADALRLSPGTVKSRLHYARLALKREVERQVHD